MINKLKVSNFKSFSDKEFEFTNHNHIEGRNGSGKTAIKDAIIYGLYGRTAQGKTVGTETYITRGEQSLKVDVSIKDARITRERSERGSKSPLYIDGSQNEENATVAQRDLEGNAIPFYEDFLSVFNVGYFMTMPEKERRKFFVELLPAVDRLELFKKAGGSEDVLTKYHTTIDTAFYDIKAILKDTKDELAEDKANLKYVITNTDNPTNMSLGALQQKLATMQEANIKAVESINEWIKFETRNMLYTDQLEKSAHNKALITEVERAMVDLPSEPDPTVTDALIEQRDAFRPVEIPKGQCPTCHQEMDATHVAKVEEENVKRAVKWDALTAKITKQTEAYEKERKAFNETRHANIAREGQLKELRNFEEEEAPTQPTEPKRETVDVSPLEVLIGQLEEVQEIEKNIEEYNETLEELQFYYDLFSPKGIPMMESDIKMKTVSAMVSEIIPGLKIITNRLLKNGMEYVDCFDVQWKKKTYARLSSGEKKKVDIALSLIINQLLEKRVSVGTLFIDDCDLFDDKALDTMMKTIDAYHMQAFYTHVSNSKLKLYDRSK